MSLIINDYYELLALHKALIEAKFSIDPNNRDISGSPIIAKLFNRVIEELIVAEEEKFKKNTRFKWERWLDIKKHMPNKKGYIQARFAQLLEDGYSDEQINKILQQETNSKYHLCIWDAAVINCKNNKEIYCASLDRQKEIANNYLSPFICTDEDICLFIKQVLE